MIGYSSFGQLSRSGVVLHPVLYLYKSEITKEDNKEDGLIYCVQIRDGTYCLEAVHKYH